MELEPVLGLAVDDGVVARVVDAMRFSFHAPESFHLGHGGGATGVTLERLARWAIAQSVVKSPDAVSDSLMRMFQSDSAVAYEYMVLTGIEVDHQLDLGNGIDLIPMADVAPSVCRDNVMQIRRRTEFDPVVTPRVAIPGCALRTQHEVSPLVADRPESIRCAGRYGELGQVAGFLTLAGPSAVVPLAHWFTFDSWVPLAAEFNPFWIPLYDIPPWPGSPNRPPVQEIQRAVEVFRLASPAMLRKVDLALNRLNLALSRQSTGDRYVELGIGLESLLTGNEKVQGIGRTLARRAGWLLRTTSAGATATGERVRTIYNLRSTFVHGDDLPKRTTIGEGRRAREVSVEDYADEACTLLRDLIGAFILLGDVPDWSRVLS